MASRAPWRSCQADVLSCDRKKTFVVSISSFLRRPVYRPVLRSEFRASTCYLTKPGRCLDEFVPVMYPGLIQAHSSITDSTQLRVVDTVGVPIVNRCTERAGSFIIIEWVVTVCQRWVGVGEHKWIDRSVLYVVSHDDLA